MDESEWIDVSLTLKSGMLHWPGDPPVAIERVRDMDKGDTVNLSKMSMGAHSGTHVDAPVHFVSGGAGIDRVSLDALVGPARIIDVSASDSIREEELSGWGIEPGERILLRTRNSLEKLLHGETFTANFIFMEEDAARFLAARGVRVVGVDYLSVGGYKKNGPQVHKILLGAGIVVVEGLDLSLALPGQYDMICLPMKIADGDGAPARVILRKKQLDR
jgi:arylformamidase